MESVCFFYEKKYSIIEVSIGKDTIISIELDLTNNEINEKESGEEKTVEHHILKIVEISSTLISQMEETKFHGAVPNLCDEVRDKERSEETANDGKEMNKREDIVGKTETANDGKEGNKREEIDGMAVTETTGTSKETENEENKRDKENLISMVAISVVQVDQGVPHIKEGKTVTSQERDNDSEDMHMTVAGMTSSMNLVSYDGGSNTSMIPHQMT